VAVIGFDRFGIDLHRGAQAGINQSHEIDLLPHVVEEILFSEMVAGEKRLPGIVASGLGILFSRLGDAGGDFGIAGMAEVGGLNLLAQEFLIDETVENSSAVI